MVTDDWAKLRGRKSGSLRGGLRTYLTAMFAVLMVGSVLVYHAERSAQPLAFRNIPVAMWWGIGAMTPLDSGMSPITMPGRAIAAVTSVCGLGLFAFLIHVVGTTLAQGRSAD